MTQKTQKTQNPSLKNDSPARRGTRGPAPKPLTVNLNAALVADRLKVLGHVRLIDTITKSVTKAFPMILQLSCNEYTLCGGISYEVTVYVPAGLVEELSTQENPLQIGQPLQVTLLRKLKRGNESMFILETCTKLSVAEYESKAAIINQNKYTIVTNQN